MSGSRYDTLANVSYAGGYPSKEDIAILTDEQPFPSINTMNRPVTNADESIDIYLGPDSLGTDRNWLRTLPGKGFFVILRIYGPTQEFFDKQWEPSDVVKVR